MPNSTTTVTPPPSRGQISAYYDEHSKRMLRDFVRGNKRVDAAVKLVMEATGPGAKRVLDIGCGIGTTSNAYAQANGELTVHGVDISPKSIEIAKALFGSRNVTFAVSDLSTVPEGAPFDVVALVDVYEHVPLEVRPRFHRVLAESLAPDGTIVLTAPSTFHQQYLREHDPAGLQIVDEIVSVDDLSQFAKDLGATLTYYKLAAIWSTNDYFHAVLQRNPGYAPLPKVSPAGQPRGRRLRSGFQRLFGHDKTHATVGSRREFVRSRLGHVVD